MKNLTWLISLIFIFAGLNANGQEKSVYSQYMIYPHLVNPAAAGFNGGHTVMAGYKSKWAGFKGAPRLFTLDYNGAVNERIGLGARIYSESYGPEQVLEGHLSYAFRIKFEKMVMNIGLGAELERFTFSGDALTNPLIDPSDPVIVEGGDGITHFDASAGILAQYDQGFFFGFSMPEMIRARINDVAVGGEEIDKEFYYMLWAGYDWSVLNSDITLQPSVMIKNVRLSPLMVDVNLLASASQYRLFGGATYTIGAGNKLGMFLGGTLNNNVRIAYGYDVSFLDFQGFGSGTHEFTLSYNVSKKM